MEIVLLETAFLLESHPFKQIDDAFVVRENVTGYLVDVESVEAVLNEHGRSLEG